MLADGSFTSLYDANGSLTNRMSALVTNSYTYNLRNRLAGAVIERTDSGHAISETVNLTYNSRGSRVKAHWLRSIDGGAATSGTNIFLHDPNSPSGLSQVFEELPAFGATPTASYALGGRVVSQGRSGTISHLLPDGHGSTRLLTDGSAGISSRFTYDAFGRPLDFTANVYTAPATTMLYSGGRFDADLQQYSFGARYFNPAVGRFNQIDPFTPNQQSGANLYAYCENDPVNQTDLTGLYGLAVHRYLTEFLARAAGFDEATAPQIGREDQRVDDDTSPADLHEAARNIHLGQADYWQRVGQLLHPQQDSYAHCNAINYRNFDYSHFGCLNETGWFAGHLVHGTHSDFTWWRPEKAMLMAERTFADLRNIHGSRTGYDNPERASWNPDPHQGGYDLDAVRNFVMYPEEVRTGWVVTRPGLRNKVRRLGIVIPENLEDVHEDDRDAIRDLWNIPGSNPRRIRFASPKASEQFGWAPL